ncbi:DEAD/DEAH box helicase [Bacilli bacterium]|nr:DEAD/DEAH box helicase [Bacilli bacterium]
MVYQLFPHQTNLLERVDKEFENGHQSIMVVSPAGSGKTVMMAKFIKHFAINGLRVLFIVHRQELLDQAEESLIEEEVDLKFVGLMSVIKAKNRLSKLETPDIIVTDEAHHSKAKSYLEIYDYFSQVKKIGFTATPTRLSGEPFDDIYDVMVEGESVSWLIENQYLAPFHYYSVKLLDNKKLKKQSGEYTNSSISEAFDNKTIFGDVVKTFKEKAINEQAILYAHNVEYSKAFAKAFTEAGINAIHVASSTPKVQRENIMNGFKDKEFQILCNVDLISEGFNVPDCTTVILLRPTQSLTVFIQQSMRGMRYQPNKESIIIDHVANYLTHQLPDTERLWTLESVDFEEAELEECPNCGAVIKEWLYQEVDGVRKQICPECGKVVSVTEVKTEEEEISEIEIVPSDDANLEEITSKEIEQLALAKIARQKQYNYKSNLLALVQIFIARNKLDGWYNDKPIWSALAFFVRQNRKQIDEMLNSEIVLEHLETVEEHFGEEYEVSSEGMLKWMKKIAKGK